MIHDPRGVKSVVVVVVVVIPVGIDRDRCVRCGKFPRG